MKIKTAVIGCGMIANSAHIPAYKYFFDDYEIVAVCDASEKSARETAEKHGIGKYYTDAQKMLEEQKPQLVSVCAPNFLHGEMTKLALSFGASVLCEKPLALSYDEASEMFALAREKGVALMACQSMRFTPDRLAAKRFIENGGLGDAYYAEFSRIRRRGIPTWGTFHIKEKNGGGAFIDIGVHMLDALVWLLGNPKIISVNATCAKNHATEIGSLKGSGALTGEVANARKFDPDEMNVEDFSSGSMLFEGGLRVNFTTAWAANMPDASSIRIAGKKSGITLPECKIYTGESGEESLSTDDEIYAGEAFSGHFHIVENMRRVLRDGAEPVIKPEETLNVCKIIDLIYKSAEKGE